MIKAGTDQSILPGTKRAVFMEMLRNHGFEVLECQTSLEEFLRADAAVFTGTATGAVAIAEVFDPLNEARRKFDLNFELRRGLKLGDVIQEYDLMIKGEKVDKVNAELQRRIRTLVRL